jgi:hypothetical protein
MMHPVRRLLATLCNADEMSNRELSLGSGQDLCLFVYGGAHR